MTSRSNVFYLIKRKISMWLEAIFSIGTIVLVEVIGVVTREVIRHLLNPPNKFDFQDQHQYSQYNNKSAKDITDELETIDIEVVDLERKNNRDGYKSRNDQERREELEFLRGEKFKKYQEIKKKEILEDQSKKSEDYETSILTNNSTHILQYHMGQVVLEKKCRNPRCGRPMVLKSKSRLDGSLYRLDDFFWSCTGFHNPPNSQCRGIQNFKAADIGFLHKSDIFEFQVSSQELSIIFDAKSIKTATVDRVKSHLKQKDDETLCPIHHIPMLLREKLDHQGMALDMFSLRCPHQGCQQLVKLKSPAQLAAYLSRQEGRGIL